MSHLMNTPSHRPISPVSTRRFDGTVGLTTLIIAWWIMDFSVCMIRTFLEVRAYENIRTRHKRSHLYAGMMAKMALRRYELLLLAAGRADALLYLQ